LSASLAHEIKNPLASIRSSVEQLSRMPHVSDDERTLTALVLHESDRLSRLLTEFLDFARVRVVRLRPVDLGDVARNAARLVTAHPDRKESVRVICQIPQRVSLVVDGDEDVIHRAVFNLLLNAVQASPDKAEVRVEVTPGSFDPLPVGVSYDSGTVALRVSDDGSGVALEIRERMFDPFFTTKPGGSGLGLAVVQRAVEAHRGLVFVDSATRGARNSGAPVSGTRFTIVLPRTQPTASGTPPGPSAAVPAIRPSFPLRSAS
jgi:two-component system, NtrC family, sensor histidine kinase PilS